MGQINQKPIFTAEGYFEEFYRILGDHESHVAAYEFLEAKLADDFGVKMYDTYDGFKKGKKNYLEGKKFLKGVSPV